LEGGRLTAERAEHNRMMAAEIRGGLAASEFEPFFQPIVSLKDGQVAGFEALARWRNPERGLVPPIEFVGPAEATGLIRAIDLAIMERAWRALDEALELYPQPGPLPILSVNLSGEHFLDGAIVDAVRALFNVGRGRLSRLQLEITETLLINNTDSAEQILGQLKALGVSIALDDFGTGYSSLVYLHRFPIDCLKIDRSFSELIARSDRSRAIVRSIVNLAQSMGIRSVAEGVEEIEVVNELVALGCQYAQGTWFGRPLPESALVELLEQRAETVG
jgi:EAL domain-containing protein (putative c-di-GMP-specific phosphodiesterase class I)